MVAENDATQVHHTSPRTAVAVSKDSVDNGASAHDTQSSERFFCEELEEDLGEAIESSNADEQRLTHRDAMVQYVANNLIGRNEVFDSPFGDRALCYADFTASGKSLQSIEDYIQREVMPLYGNTHTTTSITGLQTTCFRHEARQIIAQAVNAKITGRGAEDAVLFTGQGTTSAVSKLVTALGLHVPWPSTADNNSQRPVVFVGPFEHHSNLLPWRESAAQVVVIPENDQGHVDIQVLTQKLQQYASRPLKIGAFSAASNLTGILTDVDLVTATLHMHGALAFWDYATAAPYVGIDMNPVVGDSAIRPYVYKDAVYFSGHKFVGGPGSPGVLVVKKRLLGNAVPTTTGGGTVFFVTENDHRYLSNREEREEGGTPDILGSIRLGLAFEVKQRIGVKHIMELERQHVARVRSSLMKNEKIVLLGRHEDGKQVDQLPVFSFLIRWGDRFLHYNFVCALLNDLFGIQTRGGCQCAGPYAIRLLGMMKNDVFALEHALLESKEMLRPGFTRMSIPYFMDDADVEYILEAIHFVADEGWKFLPQYTVDMSTGIWKHNSHVATFSSRGSLSSFTMDASSSHSPYLRQSIDDIASHRRSNFETARAIAANSVKRVAPVQQRSNELASIEDGSLWWFVRIDEVVTALASGVVPPVTSTITGPCQPQRYVAQTTRLQWEVEPDYTSRVLDGEFPLRTAAKIDSTPNHWKRIADDHRAESVSTRDELSSVTSSTAERSPRRKREVLFKLLERMHLKKQTSTQTC